MKKAHALGAGVIGVALSATAALAAAPLATSTLESSDGTTGVSAPIENQQPADNHGAVVSAVAKDRSAVGGEHDNHGGAVSAVAHGDEGPSSATGASAPTEDEAPADNHGAVVSAVAKDKTAVGGKHDNHGGAVSEAAHGDHGPNSHANGNASGHH